MSLDGKVILVTGGSSGIGKAAVRAFALTADFSEDHFDLSERSRWCPIVPGSQHWVVYRVLE